jgi:hypothetical protein
MKKIIISVIVVSCSLMNAMEVENTKLDEKKDFQKSKDNEPIILPHGAGLVLRWKESQKNNNKSKENEDSQKKVLSWVYMNF